MATHGSKSRRAARVTRLSNVNIGLENRIQMYVDARRGELWRNNGKETCPGGAGKCLYVLRIKYGFACTSPLRAVINSSVWIWPICNNTEGNRWHPFRQFSASNVQRICPPTYHRARAGFLKHKECVYRLCADLALAPLRLSKTNGLSARESGEACTVRPLPLSYTFAPPSARHYCCG